MTENSLVQTLPNSVESQTKYRICWISVVNFICVYFCGHSNCRK